MAAAYAALASLMHTINKIEHHHAPPISLDKKQAQSLTQNITFLQGFLESYNLPVPDDEESPDPLAMHIADAAYAAEDVIESHIVDTIRLSSSSRPNQTKLTRLFNCFHYPKKEDEMIKFIKFYENLEQVIEEMDSVTKMATMSINTSEEAVAPAIAASVAASSTGPSSSRSTNMVVVGLKEASLQIMEKLIEDRPDRQVIPIVGMGGIGKTTLARNIYAQKLIKDRFDICAWATISQQYNTRDILCEVYSQLSGISEADELGLKVHQYLSGRRFLIVMDDMWSIDAWNEIQYFFPNDKNGSRIIVTTRLFELSSQLNNEYSHEVSFLDKATSWDLFSETVFGEKNICPRELEKIGKKIVKSCRGLPLSILVVGGLLKKMDATQRCWESIRSNLASVVNLENNKHCLRLLRLSYNHLPVHLKSCFLYVGMFKEDSQISVSTLVKLWISEGFIKPTNGEVLETSGKRFLRELVDRNLVQISKLGSTGNIKCCTIHDLMRDLCLKEGQRDGLYHVLGQRNPRCISSQRRIVIPTKASKRKALRDLRSMTHARSIICENMVKVLGCRNLGLLRTFHAYKTFYYAGSPNIYKHSLALQNVNLRHLNINHTRTTSSFLSSASLLWNLHTIIVSNPKNPTATIPEFWKMPQLRHIYFGNNDLCLPDPPNVDDDAMIIMENLQVLKGVRDFKCCEGVVKRIPNIRKLEILYTGIMGTNTDEYCFISNIKLLCKLESLSIIILRECILLNDLTFQHSIKRLKLYFPSFEHSNMLEKLGSLPFLEKLCLGSKLFRRWEIVEGQFPSLKYLSLYYCSGLEHWTIAEEESSIFPCLEQIHLYGLEELKSIPREIGYIPMLHKICISFCSKETVMSAKKMVEEQMELLGDKLPFRVEVILYLDMYEELQSLSGPNFEVKFSGDSILEILFGELDGR